MTRRIGGGLGIAVVLVLLLTSFAWAQTPEPTATATSLPTSGCPYGNFVDSDDDGVCDYQGSAGRAVWQTEVGGGMARMMHGRHNYVDADQNGVCEHFTDADNDGVCDNCPGGQAAHQGRWNWQGPSGGHMRPMRSWGGTPGWAR